MRTYQGIAVSGGVVIGEAMIIDNGRCRINRRSIVDKEVSSEIFRLSEAIDTAAAQIARNRDSVAKELGDEYGHIFSAHLQILSDAKLKRELEEHIRKDLFSAEFAVAVTFDRHAAMLQKIGGNGISERANDITDIENRLLRLLMGIRRESIAELSHPVVILSSNLTPSETANLDRDNVLAFATEEGGRGSHTAIVASAMQIPAVLGLGEFLRNVDDGDLVIIDGRDGLLIVEPDLETTQKYEDQIKKDKTLSDRLNNLTDEPAITKDQVEIEVYGNIEFPYEAKICREKGAAGIGLYRTEFLYLALNPEDLPSEDVHFEAYKQAVEAMQGRVTTIRTFDLGADKLPGFSLTDQVERNPFMGVRSIRLSLRNTGMFRKQLRAILRASAYGKLRVMFPLVSTIMEFRQAKMIFSDVCEELYEEGVPFDDSIPLGIMVEVPATVIMLETFGQEVDFFSIGTNDLVQYTLAVDRSNKEVGRLYNSEDPALIRLVRRAIDVAAFYSKPISLCGQMSSDPIDTMLLLGLGLRHFSVSPSAIPEIKELCRQVTIKECREIVQRVMFMETARDIRNYLKRETENRIGSLSTLNR